MTGWLNRYSGVPGDDTPDLPYKFRLGHISLPDNSILNIPLKYIGLNQWALDYDYFLEHLLPILPDIIEANENAILEHKTNKSTATEIAD